MAAELGKAYVQIIPSAEGISGKLSSLLGGESSAAGKAAGASIGSSLVSALGGVLAAAGIGSMVKKSLEAGGALQQSFGGLRPYTAMRPRRRKSIPMKLLKLAYHQTHTQSRLFHSVRP